MSLASVFRRAAVANLLAVLPAWAAEAPAQPGVDASSLLRLIVGLVVVIGAIVVLGWMLRRVGGVSQQLGGQLKVLAGVSVGQRERVVLLQVGKQQLLIGVAPGRVQTLHVLDEPLEGWSEPPAGGSLQVPFAERLKAAMQQRDEKRR